MTEEEKRKGMKNSVFVFLMQYVQMVFSHDLKQFDSEQGRKIFINNMILGNLCIYQNFLDADGKRVYFSALYECLKKNGNKNAYPKFDSLLDNLEFLVKYHDESDEAALALYDELKQALLVELSAGKNITTKNKLDGERNILRYAGMVYRINELICIDREMISLLYHYEFREIPSLVQDASGGQEFFDKLYSNPTSFMGFMCTIVNNEIEKCNKPYAYDNESFVGEPIILNDVDADIVKLKFPLPLVPPLCYNAYIIRYKSNKGDDKSSGIKYLTVEMSEGSPESVMICGQVGAEHHNYGPCPSVGAEAKIFELIRKFE